MESDLPDSSTNDIRMPMRVAFPTWLLVVATILFSGCSRREPPVSVASVQAEGGPDQESWNPELFISENGRARIHMTARYMAHYERGDSTYKILSGTADPDVRVRVYLFDESGDSSAVIDADRLTYFDQDKRFVARGNVIVVTRDSIRLESEHLAWSELRRQVTTPGFFRYSSKSANLEGYELVADEDLKNYTISRPSGVFTPEEE